MDRIGDHTAHLPSQPTPLVGRSRDLDAAAQRLLLEETRLLTLTGPAGVGKTRLAIAVAARVADAFPDGAWFVDLTPLRDPELVPSAIAQSLGVHATRGTAVAERLVAFLESRRLLLVLDNFETVLPAATFVAQILATSPGLKVLAASRERLRLRWERTFAVAPLALPDLGVAHGVDTLSQVAAVALFVDRARAADADFALTSANAATVAEICIRLDGLPLAIELAAARANVLPPAKLLARLDRLGLHWEAPDLPRRHQSLRAAFDCSFDLLAADQQALLRRLAVFAGGWTLEAAECVAVEGDGAADALDGLAGLADKSLIRALSGASEDEPRFDMLETIREYGLEQLRASGEVELIRRRHAACFVELAERIEPSLLGAQQRRLLDVLEREHDDLRAALHWAADTGESGVELRLATALAYFWRMRGHLAEGRRRLEAALARGTDAAAPIRARALDRCATLATWQGEYERVTPQLDEALALAQASDDWHTAADIFASMAVAAWQQQAFDRAVTLSEEGLRLRRRQGDTLGLALALRNLGPQLLSVGNHERSRVILEEALGLFRDLGGQRDCAVILGALADVALVQGDANRAIALLHESLPIARQVADRRAIAHSATILVEHGLRFGQPERVARLAGALDAWREEMGAIRQASRLAEGVDAVRTALGEQVFNRAAAEGRGLTLDQVVDEALAILAAVPSAAGVPDRLPPRGLLSEREREVLRLLADGLSNQEIAQALVVTSHTAKFHVASILNKLGASTRGQAVALAVERNLLDARRTSR